MVSFTTLIATLSLAIPALAYPTSSNPLHVFSRQTIPVNYLYAVTMYPHGCGNTDGAALFYGDSSTLATCTVPGGWDVASDQVSVQFTFPDDGTTYNWRVFSSSGCETQVALGSGAVCTNVPKGQVIGAFIVFT